MTKRNITKIDLATFITIIVLLQSILTYFIDTRVNNKCYIVMQQLSVLEEKYNSLHAQYSFWLTQIVNENWSGKNSDDMKKIINILESIKNG
jgi:hypothetical protein